MAQATRRVGIGPRLIRFATPSLLMLGLMGTSPVSEAQEPSLVDVLVRTTDYVNGLIDQLSGTVAEERYEQRSRESVTAFGPLSQERRVLRSDYLLVEPEGVDRYYGFRDVFEVDGRAVRDREDRLTRLFLDPSVSVKGADPGDPERERSVQHRRRRAEHQRSDASSSLSGSRIRHPVSVSTGPRSHPTCGSSRIGKRGRPR